MNYYNEIDTFAAAWLRELIAAKLIAPGIVDERSIRDIRPDELKQYTQCHFFAGIGGWSLALRLAGWADDKPVWTGSCPCQPFSTAGKRKGKEDARHLWPIWHRLIRECEPPVIFGEQVAAAASAGWLDDVYQGLEEQGYAVGTAVLPAISVGKAHRRDRLFFGAVGDPKHDGQFRCSLTGCDAAAIHLGSSRSYSAREFEGASTPKSLSEGFVGHAIREGLERLAGDGNKTSGRQVANGSITPTSLQRKPEQCLEWIVCGDNKARPAKSGLPLLANGLSGNVAICRTGIIRGLGNAIVPKVAAEFIGAFVDAVSDSVVASHSSLVA